ncbi:MAG: phage tail tape measure protein [Clostridia bacterium]|nr:phage tail tape measure protein [Clostridia bacterium]
MAKKTEAEITFSANVKDFDEGIKEMNTQLKQNRNELKLNATQMKGAGETVELLTDRQKILKDELEAATEKVRLNEEELKIAEQTLGKNSKEYQNLTNAVINAKNQQQSIQNELDATTNKLEAMQTSTEDTRNSFEKLNDKIDEEEKQLLQLKDAYKSAVIETGKESDESKELASQIEKLSAEIKDDKRQMDEANAAADDFDKTLEELGDDAKKTDDGFTVLKGTLANLASEGISRAVDGLKEVGKETIEIGKDFTASMSKVQSISGATGDEFEQLKGKARELGESTKFSATEVSDGFQYMAMAGWDTQSMLEGIDGVLALSAADGLDLATTSDIVTDSLTAFGLSADQAGHFADVLAQTGRNANTNVSMLGESFKYVAPVAGSLGYSVEDVSVALGLMANAGIKASQGGTALRTILTNLSKPSDEMAKAMDYLDISLQNNDGSMKSLMEVMTDLRSSFGNTKLPMDQFQKSLAELEESYNSGSITEKQYNKATEDLMEKAYGAEGALKAKYAATLAGKTGMAGLLAIVNTGQGDFDKLTNSIDNASGTAKEMADTMQNNLSGDLTVMNSELEGAALNLYDKIEPAARGVVGVINDSAIPALNFLIDNLPTVGVAFAGITAAIVAFKVASISAKLATEGFTIATKLQAVAQGALNTVLNLNPIGFVILAITAAVVAIKYAWDNCEGFRNFVIGAGQKIKEVVQNTVEAVKNKFTEWQNKIASVKQSFSDMKANVSQHITDLKNKVSSTFDAIHTAITKPVEKAKETVLGIVNKIKSAFNFKWSLPPLKIPHISVSGGKAPFGIGGKGSLPKFNIVWHAKGAVFTQPTIFQNANGNLNGFGEAGTEYGLPLNRRSLAPLAELLNELQLDNGGILGAIANRFDIGINKVLDRLDRLELIVNIDGRRVAEATAGYSDDISGSRAELAERGLSL